jgi:hypothetical protein
VELVKHIPQLFKTEKDAERYLENILSPYFRLLKQCRLKHLETGQPLRIDYLARPLSDCNYQFDVFGIEVKRGDYTKANIQYNKPLWQAVDYTHCKINDKRANGFNGKRLERVYLFPGLSGEDCQTIWGVNRLVGIGHVGTILINRKFQSLGSYPAFYMCDTRQWCPESGPHAGGHKTTQKLGSGVPRADG